MTSPIGSNPPPQVEFTSVDGTQTETDGVTNSEALNSAIKSSFHDKIRETARELIDRLSDENFWDAKSDGLENGDELIEQQKLFEHLQELGLIATKAGALEQLNS